MAKTGNRIRFWCELALALITVAVAVLFITQTADIYFSAADGAQVYTRDTVAGKLKIMIAPAVIWFVGAVACFILSVVYPSAPEKRKAGKATVVRNLIKKLPNSLDEEGYNAERKRLNGYELGRYIIYGVATGFSVASAIVTIVYLARSSNFRSAYIADAAINDDILGLVKNVFPFIIASFILFVAAAVYEFATAKAELGSIKKLLIAAKSAPISRSPLTQKLEAFKRAMERAENGIVLGVRIAIGVVAAVFIGIGAANGGASDVLYKAIKICTECIGLG